ncbi:MAG TPA: 16S rRNA (guanine(966)-N(2))-methyltransferase RsmD [Gammaproteobacteria bacterium]|nr:16S rRNA (guanine(966)-N(2))-methyltransferase RsmD [Gammaproteobacteria bacterium]
MNNKFVTNSKNATSQVRIIGGKWRSRKITFPNVAGLRPTPNRVRETLFNWLAPHIHNAKCLDLFAGSGALGFEALSRGAHSVVMVEQSAQVVAQLHTNAKLLAAEALAEIFCQRIEPQVSILQNRQFDIVFLDPPFHQGWIPLCCQLLEISQCLTPGALIYIEAECELQPLPIPSNWNILRQQKAGQVSYYLIQYAKI